MFDENNNQAKLFISALAKGYAPAARRAGDAYNKETSISPPIHLKSQ